MSTEEEKYARRQLCNLLLNMGIFPSAVGHFAIMECVIAAIEGGMMPVRMSDVYQKAGSKLNRTASAVEHSIRVALLRSLQEGKMTAVNEYFDCEVCNDEYYLRSSELVSLCAYKILDEYKSIVI